MSKTIKIRSFLPENNTFFTLITLNSSYVQHLPKPAVSILHAYSSVTFSHSHT